MNKLYLKFRDPWRSVDEQYTLQNRKEYEEFWLPLYFTFGGGCSYAGLCGCCIYDGTCWKNTGICEHCVYSPYSVGKKLNYFCWNGVKFQRITPDIFCSHYNITKEFMEELINKYPYFKNYYERKIVIGGTKK